MFKGERHGGGCGAFQNPEENRRNPSKPKRQLKTRGVEQL